MQEFDITPSFVIEISVNNWIAKSDRVVINHGFRKELPSIFKLYVNDFSKAVSTNCDVSKFADDTAIMSCKD